MSAPAFTNKLIGETSPYLLQHAHNPVNWYPWSEEALALARKKDIPILVSIGYAACHWCHVMERESFEDPETAEMMNQGFVNIKIDREERPDLDNIYMEAVQIIAGNGGWPLNVFLTPDAKPFYGGTYFPPHAAFNKPSWKDVLNSIGHSWKNRREEILEQANELTAHITRSNHLFTKNIQSSKDLNTGQQTLSEISETLLKLADEVNGGFGQPPKFPQFALLRFMLAYGHYHKNEEAKRCAHFSLLKIIRGGIFDQAGGGMARYSVDEKWLVPHFEKMLYDNALLLQILAEAFQENKNEEYRQAALQTIDWLEIVMKGKQGGYMAAIDADSDGEEGKFYLWNHPEWEELLGEDAELLGEYYGITREGNFENQNILFRKWSIEEYAELKEMDISFFQKKIQKSNQILLNRRNTRIHPRMDNKIILGWNALLVTGFIKCGFAFSLQMLVWRGVELFEYLKKQFTIHENELAHSFKNIDVAIPAFLDDYAYMAEAGMLVYEATGNLETLEFVNSLIFKVIDEFEEEKTGMFYYTSYKQNDLIARKIETFDGASPSGNSKMAGLLIRLGQINGLDNWTQKGFRLLENVKEIATKYPSSFGNWCMELLAGTIGYPEIVISGKEAGEKSREILTEFLPFRILQWSEKGMEGNLFKGREAGGDTVFYVCHSQNCYMPVKDAIEAVLLLKKMGC